MSFNVDVNGLRPYRNYKVLKLKQMRPDSEECLRPYRNYKVLKPTSGYFAGFPV